MLGSLIECVLVAIGHMIYVVLGGASSRVPGRAVVVLAISTITHWLVAIIDEVEQLECALIIGVQRIYTCLNGGLLSGDHFFLLISLFFLSL